MDGSEWDFSKLPEELHSRVRELLEKGDANALLEIHDDYELSDYDYCCGVPISGVLVWFKHGIDKGLIQ